MPLCSLTHGSVKEFQIGDRWARDDLVVLAGIATGLIGAAVLTRFDPVGFL